LHVANVVLLVFTGLYLTPLREGKFCNVFGVAKRTEIFIIDQIGGVLAGE